MTEVDFAMGVVDEDTGDLVLGGIVPIVMREMPTVRAGFGHRYGRDGNDRYGDRLTFYNATTFCFDAAGAFATVTPTGPNNSSRQMVAMLVTSPMTVGLTK